MIECQYETYPTPSQADSGESAEGETALGVERVVEIEDDGLDGGHGIE